MIEYVDETLHNKIFSQHLLLFHVGLPDYTSILKWNKSNSKQPHPHVDFERCEEQNVRKKERKKELYRYFDNIEPQKQDCFS